MTGSRESVTDDNVRESDRSAAVGALAEHKHRLHEAAVGQDVPGTAGTAQLGAGCLSATVAIYRCLDAERLRFVEGVDEDPLPLAEHHEVRA